jgi:hypothetical protein
MLLLIWGWFADVPAGDNAAAQRLEPLLSALGGPLPDDTVRLYIQTSIALPLAKAMGAPGLLNVHVVEEAGAQAVLLPSGDFVLTAGLLRKLRTEAQLAGVLAHLLSHHVAGDLQHRLDQAPAATSVWTLATEPWPLTLEASRDEKALRALNSLEYPTAAYAEALLMLAPKSGRPTPFGAQHPTTPDRLREARDRSVGNRGTGSDYHRRVLDVIGVFGSAAGEASPKPAPGSRPVQQLPRVPGDNTAGAAAQEQDSRFPSAPPRDAERPQAVLPGASDGSQEPTDQPTQGADAAAGAAAPSGQAP